MAKGKRKSGKLQVFKGREAKLNYAIFRILALKGPQTIYDRMSLSASSACSPIIANKANDPLKSSEVVAPFPRALYYYFQFCSNYLVDLFLSGKSPSLLNLHKLL